jgi:hypothetical protein
VGVRVTASVSGGKSLGMAMHGVVMLCAFAIPSQRILSSGGRRRSWANNATEASGRAVALRHNGTYVKTWPERRPALPTTPGRPNRASRARFN